MRKAQKQQAENFITLLDQVHDEIKKAIETKKNVEALRLLEQCQNRAIQLGALIEHAESEEFVTVRLLEEYCEMLYCIHEEIVRDQVINANKVYKNLRKILIKIENSVKNDIEIRIEVVLLPYKASMWDSLESVWKSMHEKKNCDTYVIPIPYYDKNPDGSFREMHYEGNLYPDYVPVTHYETFDFAKHQPDMIFIHNPYDGYNHVTSVHPFFYSKNLKQFTEQLIYIPYFILEEINPNDEERVKNMEHFCTVPAVIYADKVIVQSEDMRQIYINVMMKTLGKEPYGRKYWEEKILGLGSPKVDKVLNTRKSDLEIPPEWMKVIQKPDGNMKKIVFYNTSVNALLKHGDKMLRKVENVFRIFKEYREEVVLLWRPHPLIKAAIESMRPQLWTKYKKIIKQYREEAWGIYDDTADMNRAVALSDVYYGDRSSIVQLYQKTGKMVMIQSVKVATYNCVKATNEEDMSKGMNLTFEAIAIKGNVGYASDYEYNGLYQVNMTTGVCEYLGIFPDELVSEKRIHCCAKWIENRIYFIPAAGDKISIFNVDDKSLQSLKIPLQQNPRHTFYMKKYKFIEAVVLDSYLWLVPSTYPGVLRLDIYTNEIKVFDKWIPDTGYMFRRGLCVREKQFFIPSGNNNVVLMFDMEKEIGSIVYVGKNNNGSISMCDCAGRYWLAPRLGGAIISWDPNTDSAKEYIGYPDEFKYREIVFSKNYAFGDQIIFSPASANFGIVISEDTIKIDKSICWKTESESIVEYLFETEEYLYFREIYMNRDQNRFFRVLRSTNTQTDYCFKLLDSTRRKQEVISLAIHQGGTMIESAGIGLQDLMNSLI